MNRRRNRASSWRLRLDDYCTWDRRRLWALQFIQSPNTAGLIFGIGLLLLSLSLTYVLLNRPSKYRELDEKSTEVDVSGAYLNKWFNKQKPVGDCPCSSPLARYAYNVKNFFKQMKADDSECCGDLTRCRCGSQAQAPPQKESKILSFDLPYGTSTEENVEIPAQSPKQSPTEAPTESPTESPKEPSDGLQNPTNSQQSSDKTSSHRCEYNAITTGKEKQNAQIVSTENAKIVSNVKVSDIQVSHQEIPKNSAMDKVNSDHKDSCEQYINKMYNKLAENKHKISIMEIAEKVTDFEKNSDETLKDVLKADEPKYNSTIVAN